MTSISLAHQSKDGQNLVMNYFLQEASRSLDAAGFWKAAHEVYFKRNNAFSDMVEGM